MNKLKLNSRRQVFQKFGSELTIVYKDGKGKEKKMALSLQKTLFRTNKFNINTVAPYETFTGIFEPIV